MTSNHRCLRVSTAYQFAEQTGHSCAFERFVSLIGVKCGCELPNDLGTTARTWWCELPDRKGFTRGRIVNGSDTIEGHEMAKVEIQAQTAKSKKRFATIAF